MDAKEAPDESQGTVTKHLNLAAKGDKLAEEQAVDALYADLKKRAGVLLRGEHRRHTLSPTDLVDEAYIRLAGERKASWNSRGHYLAVAAKVMRHVLVDHARAKHAAKRPDRRQRVELDSAVAAAVQHPEFVIAIDQALGRLEKKDARISQVIEF